MKKKTSIKFLTLVLATISILAIKSYAFDYCKGNHSKNDGTCEQQCSSQVECVKPATGTVDCYGHGMEQPTLPIN